MTKLEANNSLTDLIREFNTLIDKYMNLRFIRLPLTPNLEEAQKRLDTMCQDIELIINVLTLKIKALAEVEK